jgi:hypothetical protein
MSTITPLIITLAVLSPLLALMVSLYLRVQRHRQPDAARIKVLRGLLWFLFFVVLTWLLSLILFGVFGAADIFSAESVLLPPCSILLVTAGIFYQIHQCQRRWGQK